MVRIAITGGFLTGKSTVAGLFRDKKVTVLDSDRIYAKLLGCEKKMQQALVEEYGKTIAKSGGLGIADAVQRELLGLQEVPSK